MRRVSKAHKAEVRRAWFKARRERARAEGKCTMCRKHDAKAPGMSSCLPCLDACAKRRAVAK